MSDIDMESQQQGFTLTENGDKISPPISPPESVDDISDYFSMLDIQDIDVKDDTIQDVDVKDDNVSKDNIKEDDVKEDKAKDDRGLDSGPKRGSVGLDITVYLDRGEAADLKTKTVEEIFHEYGYLKRIVIDLDPEDAKRAYIKVNAWSVSEALRIIRNQRGEDFDVMGFKGKLTAVIQRAETVGLKFKKNDQRHYDFQLDQCEYHKMPIRYDARWFGRQYTYWSDYKEVMLGWPADDRHLKMVIPDDQYARFPKVAKFWLENCGVDFPVVWTKLGKAKTDTLKADLDDFYNHLFTAIFDKGMGVVPEWGLCDELADELKGLKGFVIDVMQHRASGSIMIVEYIFANFSGKPLILNSESSDEHGSSSDEEAGRGAKRPVSNSVSKDVLEATQIRLKTYATDDGPLYLSAASEWIYGTTVYRDKVFYTRMNRETAKFQFLSPQDAFVSADIPRYRRPLWQPVVTEKGYRRFQVVLNEMDNSVALK